MNIMAKEYRFEILKNYDSKRLFVIMKEKDSFLSTLEDMLFGG